MHRSPEVPAQEECARSAARARIIRFAPAHLAKMPAGVQSPGRGIVVMDFEEDRARAAPGERPQKGIDPAAGNAPAALRGRGSHPKKPRPRPRPPGHAAGRMPAPERAMTAAALAARTASRTATSLGVTRMRPLGPNTSKYT